MRMAIQQVGIPVEEWSHFDIYIALISSSSVVNFVLAIYTMASHASLIGM